MKIISGGQTGADQAGLRAARALGLRTGGYAPMGWLTEDGPKRELLEGFGLIEAQRPGYPYRTFLNVEHADGVVWFGDERSPGGLCTNRAIRRFSKPALWNPADPTELSFWIRELRIDRLNVAGNRESHNPGIGKLVEAFLLAALPKYVVS